MEWKKLKSKEEIVASFLAFMDENRVKYSEAMQEELNQHFIETLGNPSVYSEFMQISDRLDAIAPCCNPYLGYLDMLMNNFDINCNILEVGGGCIPTFAKYLAKEQLKTGSGTITVYDPRLINRKKYGCSNMHLHKKPVDGKTNLSCYDLVVGIMPCLGTDITIELIEKYKKDFFIAFCGCNHKASSMEYFYGFYPRPSYEENIIQLEEICSKNNLGELVVDYLPDRFELDYPIVYNKRK